MTSRYVLFVLVLSGATTVPAQWTLHFDGTVPVTRQGSVLDLAWAGGINNIHVSDVDLNGDGAKDLVLFDRGQQGDEVTTLLRTSAPGVGGYVVTHAYDHATPLDTLHDWALLRDFNCDGREDIFTYTEAGFGVYKNVSSGSEPSFVLYYPRVNSNYVSPSGAGTIANLFVSEVDLPGIEDIDNDGDLDILTFSLLGSYVEYHKNLSVELYGTCDSLVYELRNKCWGYFTESLTTNNVTLNTPCPFNVPAPEVGSGGEHLAMEDPVATRAAHAGSAVLPLDLNGDGVKDLLLGDISYNNLVAIYNGGTVDDAIMVAKDSLFPVYDQPVDLTIYPCGSYEDVDADGTRDLLVGSAATSLAHNFESVWYYHNTGTDASPVFDRQQTNLFQDRMIELGEGAYPVPFDVDGDGLMDLLVANYGYSTSGLAYSSQMAVLRNTGSATEPSFEQITDDYMDLGTSGLGLGMYPAFGDLDGDGDQDLYLGDLQGVLHFYRNVATGPAAAFQLEQLSITDVSGAVIDVGQLATPSFEDLDEDGLLDLVIGERNGNLNHYRNTGTTTTPIWTLITDSLGAVNNATQVGSSGNSVPFFFRNDLGVRELLVGTASGWIHHYGNIEGNISGTWSLLDGRFQDVHDGEKSAPCVHDFTGDGVLDMVVGNYRGGLSFWRSDAFIGFNHPPSNERGFTLAPNPANEQIELWLTMGSVVSYWVIQNSMGQALNRGPVLGERTVIPVDDLAEGHYLIKLEGSSAAAVQRFVVVRGARN